MNASKRNYLLLISVVVVAISGAALFLYILNQGGAGQPDNKTKVIATRTIVLYAGERGGSYLFGLSEDNLTTPGPTIVVKKGEPVKIVLKPIGALSHTFVVVESLDSLVPGKVYPIFDEAKIGDDTKPIGPGSEGSTIFIPDKVGQYYYVCGIAGHYQLGQWGALVVVEE